jgi:hypothetical protein
MGGGTDDGVLCTVDEELIVREADRIGRAAWQRLFAERPDLSPPPGMHIAVHPTTGPSTGL